MPPLCTYRTQPPPQNCRSEAHQPDALKIIQHQMGHEHASTTGIYQFVSDDFRNTALRAALDGTMNDVLGLQIRGQW
jgi:hypothetical protein